MMGAKFVADNPFGWLFPFKKNFINDSATVRR